MSLNHSRLLIAAAATAALGAFGAAPALAAATATSSSTTMGTHDHMASGSHMASDNAPMQHNHTSKQTQGSGMHKANSGGMKVQGSMK